MAQIARVTTWTSAQTLTAAALNGEFNNITTTWNNHDSGSSAWTRLLATNASSVPLLINNSTGTNDIANFQDNGTNVVAIADGGATTLTATAGGTTVPLTVNNSTSTGNIFQCQDNGSNVLVVADGGIITAANQSAARVYVNTSQIGIAVGGYVKVQFNAETLDVKSEFDSTTNYRFTATAAGKYSVSCSLDTGGTDSSNFRLAIYKNGSMVTQFLYKAIPMDQYTMVHVDDVLSLAAADYVEIFVHKETGNVFNIINGSTASWLAIHKLA